MKSIKFAALALALAVSTGCAVNVVTVNINESDLGYVDQGQSSTINESNLSENPVLVPVGY